MKEPMNHTEVTFKQIGNIVHVSYSGAVFLNNLRWYMDSNILVIEPAQLSLKHNSDLLQSFKLNQECLKVNNCFGFKNNIS